MTKSLLAVFLFLFNCSATPKNSDYSSEIKEDIYENSPIYTQKEDSSIIDQQLSQMTLDEKIGQLFWMAAFCNKGEAEINRVKSLVKNEYVGGVTWFRDTKRKTSPTLQLKYTNQIQNVAKYPVIFSIDGEWGLNMRLDSTVQFPRQLALGAINNQYTIEEFGEEVGRQMKRMGIHVNFAPVIDVNNNPNNPVINDRSFGENKHNVVAKGIAYMQGMHKAGILATAKHFPGHGDTDTDSHLALPVLHHDRYRLETVEMYPFQQLIQNRIGAVMVAHLNVPSLDATPNRPTTLSKYVVTDLLQGQYGFDGLVITDALNMQGIAKYYGSGRAEVEALKAGNDILLYSQNVKTGINAVKKAVQSGELTEERINKSLRKILAAKRWLGILQKAQNISTQHVVADLTQQKVKNLNQKLHNEAITLVQNAKQLPFSDMSNVSIATVGIDNGRATVFQKSLAPYAEMQHFSISSTATSAQFAALHQKLKQFNTVLVGLNTKSRYKRKNFGITAAQKAFIQQLNQEGKLVLSVFGNPYSLENFTNIQTLICGYNTSAEAQKAVAEGIFGAVGFQGTLPVGVTGFPEGSGHFTQGNLRLQYSSLEQFGLKKNALHAVDSLAKAAIRMRATPGCQILIAKDNQVIYRKSFGYFTYNKKRKVKNTDLYDIASITKIAGSMPLVMQSYEQGFLGMQTKIVDMEPALRGGNKDGMKLGEVLNHTSGLRSWVPFYKKTLTKKGNLNAMYSTTPKNGYQQVAKSIYLPKTYEIDSMMYHIRESENNDYGRYVYSDLGYYIIKNYMERTYGEPFEELLNKQFIQKMGFPSMTYNPLNRFPISRIVPSENDTYYRKQVVRGYVHDMGAAMQGGVGGHAGLFATTNDLAMYMQLLLNKGSYGGVQYFQPETIQYFTKRYNYNSRKALGFDKPELDPDRSSPTCYYVSADSFGHTGFTGTYAWADPQNNIIFIFLSNRTYPSMKNRKLIKENIRTKMQEVIWKALDPTCKPLY